MKKERFIHPFEPVWDADCEILVLGTFPSVKSRENAFYYGHPQNRFWRVLAGVYGERLPQSVPEKKEMLLRYHIALWDVLESCEIEGSSDGSIAHAVPNDIAALLARCPVRHVLLNGKTAEKLYLRYWAALPVRHTALPSTSPANAAWTLERLTEEWKKAMEDR